MNLATLPNKSVTSNERVIGHKASRVLGGSYDCNRTNVFVTLTGKRGIILISKMPPLSFSWSFFMCWWNLVSTSLRLGFVSLLSTTKARGVWMVVFAGLLRMWASFETRFCKKVGGLWTLEYVKAYRGTGVMPASSTPGMPSNALSRSVGNEYSPFSA